MKFRELKSILNTLNDEQLDNDVAVLLDDVQEVYQITCFDTVQPNDDISDVLDVGHPVLVIS